MSGHSKWSTIKHKKGALDAKRGVLFTKLSREIIVAARSGGPDMDMNFRLRLSVQNAKSANMPSANIERAIAKGSGTGADGEQLEELTYEGYAPGGAAIIVQGLTDNRNRTVADVRSLFTKSGGNLAEAGAVSWGFDNKGTVLVTIVTGLDGEEVALEAVDSGAEDFELTDNSISFTTDPGNLDLLQKALGAMDGVEVDTAELAMVPQVLMELDDSHAKQTLRLLEALEDLDDVQKVFSNADFSNEVLAEYSAA
jgi:YebC/PmpR family DNA-binding regulatory protein